MLQHMKSSLVFLLGLVTGVVLTVGLYFIYLPLKHDAELLTLTFTEAELQKKLARKFPREETKFEVVQITIDEPRVELVGGNNRVRLFATATIGIPFVASERIEGVFSCSVRYNREDYTLRTSDYKVEELKTDRLPQKYAGIVEKTISIAAKELFDDQIVYTLDGEKNRDVLARTFLREIRVKKGILEVSLWP
jgi:hypothetical protein